MFLPIHTARLTVRATQPRDIDALVRRRNDPAVARYQDWPMPYPRSAAVATVTASAQMSGPTEDAWWMATVTRAGSDAPIGDLSLRLANNARTAEVGYSLDSELWGHGYALEALNALMLRAFAELPIARVSATLHPDNHASAMLLERAGLEFEGHSRLSYWSADRGSDDYHYGVTRPAWLQWRQRPTVAFGHVRLTELAHHNKSAVLALRTHHSQRRFIDPVQYALADELVPDVVDGVRSTMWLRSIEAGGATVGIVQVAFLPGHRDPMLWRLLVDRMHQRRRAGSLAIGLVAARCRAEGAGSLRASWVPGTGCPEPFYLRAGFHPTGRIVRGEVEARLPLA